MGRRTKEHPDSEIVSSKQYSKSNDLINAKGTTSLLWQKLFAISLQKLDLDEKSGIISSTIYSTDLKKLLGKTGNSIYTQLKMMVVGDGIHETLDDWKLIITDDRNKKFRAIRVITDCEYDNGVFTIRYNNLLNDKIYQLKENYTVFYLEDILQLRSQYSLRLYEILKSDYDKQMSREKKKHNVSPGTKFTKEISIEELKLEFGIIDSTTDKNIINALNEDDDLSEQQIKKADKKYKDYSNFRINVIERAWKEIREKTHIMFDYEPITSGRGGKVVAIRFLTWTKEEKPLIVPEPTLTPEEKENIIDETIGLIEEKLRIKDYKAIAEAANYNLGLIKKQYNQIKNRKNIENIVAYMIAAVKNDYPAPTPKKVTQNNSFNKFEQNTYDFEDLENKLLDN